MPDITPDELILLVEKMPAFPKSVERVIQLTADKNSTAKEIVRVLENDPVLTLKILKVTNSAFYGLPQKINSIHHAIVHLGLNTINNLALATAALGIIGNVNKAGFNTEDFLLHSITTAILSQLLAEKIQIPKDESCHFFVAGLLHDFGKIVFATFIPEQFKMALETSAVQGISLDEAEQIHLGIDHSSVGKLLALKWNLDQALINAIDHHHNKENNVLANCIFAANQISKKMQFGFAGNSVVEEFPQHIQNQFNCSLDQLIIELGDLSAVKNNAIAFIA